MGNKGSKDKNIELEMQGPEPDEEKIDLFNLPDKNLDLAPTMIEVVKLKKGRRSTYCRIRTRW
jgi:hypothetical protein